MPPARVHLHIIQGAPPRHVLAALELETPVRVLGGTTTHIQALADRLETLMAVRHGLRINVTPLYHFNISLSLFITHTRAYSESFCSPGSYLYTGNVLSRAYENIIICYMILGLTVLSCLNSMVLSAPQETSCRPAPELRNLTAVMDEECSSRVWRIW